MNPAIPVGSNGGTVSNITPAELVKVLTSGAAHILTAKFLLASPTLSIERRGHIVKVREIAYAADRNVCDLVCDVNGQRMDLSTYGWSKDELDRAMKSVLIGYSKPEWLDTFWHVSGAKVRFTLCRFRTGLESDSVENPYGFSDVAYTESISLRSFGPHEGKVVVNGEVADLGKFPKVLTLDLKFSSEAKVRELNNCSLAAGAADVMRAAGIELVLGSCESDPAYELTWQVANKFVGDDITGRHEDDDSYNFGDYVREVQVQVKWARDRWTYVSSPAPKSLEDLDDVIADMQKRVLWHTDRMAAKKASYGF